MPKQSIAQKSIYWLKVISLGLILGLGIQFAQAWTSPTIAPPGGNVSGPLTNGITAQYKTGRLGVNSATPPINALEVGGGGSILVGGNVFTAGSINATSGTVTGVLTAGKVQILDIVVEDTACTPNGLVAKDNTGMLLSCQGSPLKWKKASGGVNSFVLVSGNNTSIFTNYLVCTSTDSGNPTAILGHVVTRGGVIYYFSIGGLTGSYIGFDKDGKYLGSTNPFDCNGKTFQKLKDEGYAFN